jgi:hypothetical protein
MTDAGANIGHGHVFKRPDGVVYRCGGPKMCASCAKDLAAMTLPTPTPLTDAEIENLANQPHAYALTNAKVLATITSLQSDLQRTRDALESLQDAAHCVVWSANWKADRELHNEAELWETLTKEVENAKSALTPPTGTMTDSEGAA